MQIEKFLKHLKSVVVSPDWPWVRLHDTRHNDTRHNGFQRTNGFSGFSGLTTLSIRQYLKTTIGLDTIMQK